MDRCYSAQVALARLLIKGDDIAVIPGIKRVERVEENTAADHLEPDPEQVVNLTDRRPDHSESPMRIMNR